MVDARATGVNNLISIIIIVGEWGMVASKVVSVKDEATMTPKSVGEYAEAVRPQHLAGDRKEKGRILTGFCKVTGYHRDSAVRVLRHPPKGAGGERRGRPRIYGAGVREALRQLWEAGDRASGKLLVGALPGLVESMEGSGEIALAPEVRCQLLALSSATIDRLLKPYRELSLRRPYAQTRSVSAFRSLVPVRTFGEWERVAAGSMQMDLVSHCGESTEGFYLTTLVAVDVATGWHDCRAVWGKGKTRVGGAVEQICRALPFPLQEVHTDNGGEFLNDGLYDWCIRQGIRFTRGRPYKKNDQAYVEQRNWTLVRRRLGWGRFSSKAALEALERVYRPSASTPTSSEPLARSSPRRGWGPRWSSTTMHPGPPTSDCWSPSFWRMARGPNWRPFTEP